MEFRTKVNIDKPSWSISPTDRFLFVGSCFASSMAQILADNQFRTMANPFGVMYNPVSVLHTIEKLHTQGDSIIPDVAILTFGTNRVYILKETGEIVDNCQKRPQSLFMEKSLTVEECAESVSRSVELLRQMNPNIKIVLTVSPIRYSKYGYHEIRISKATLLLAVDKVLDTVCCDYFPSYEILDDELRDYRFYAEDMIHPSNQSVNYIFERFSETYFSEESKRFVAEYRPIRQALNHRFFNPESEESRQFYRQTQERLAAFKEKYHLL